MLEVVPFAAPPDSLLDYAVRLEQCDVLWVGEGEFAIRCEPQRPDDTVKLLLNIEGSAELKQQGRWAVIERGTYSWVIADQPFELVSGAGSRQLQIRWPRAVVGQRHPDLDTTPAVTRGLDHAGERFICGLLKTLAHEGPKLDRGSHEALVATLLEALGLAKRRASQDPLDQRIARARRDIECLLHDPSMGPVQIARRQGVSRRYLDGLFQARCAETLSAVIRRRRLERAAEQLVSEASHSVESIAHRWGFRNASHFSQAFREHFACSPTGYRSRFPHRP
ncbi:MAG TPA: helix-turn-helix transcriptional regulator [Polyangiaceae bacterium]|nr:helix-turn-helix transcriptional regulator [Polyangiaceae bacterium]